MFLTFQHCQSETLSGMHQHSPSKSYVSKTKHILYHAKKTQATNILIWQLLNSVIFRSSHTAKRSNTLSYLTAKLTTFSLFLIFYYHKEVSRKLFLRKKLKFSSFFLILEPMPNYSVCHIVLKCQLACND